MSTDGFYHVPGFLSPGDVVRLIEEAREIVRQAPLLRPRMVIGSKVLDFKLTLTNAGPWGWWSDEKGFRYVDRHPQIGQPFPPIPQVLLDLGARALTRCGLPPMVVENCLINHYAQGESLGQHQDRTEEDADAPIVSFSVGADALFLLGGQQRTDPVREYMIQSGDLVIQSGLSRRCFHGIKKVFPTMTNPLRDGGRLNFTLRKVSMSDDDDLLCRRCGGPLGDVSSTIILGFCVCCDRQFREDARRSWEQMQAQRAKEKTDGCP